MPEKYNAKLPKWNKDSIQALRSHLGLTQQEMAGQMGTRQQTISEWETGIYSPRGASATLLNILAEKAGFKYDASNSKQDL
jgi:DNA-binding transcriptional regulator YiaG